MFNSLNQGGENLKLVFTDFLENILCLYFLKNSTNYFAYVSVVFRDWRWPLLGSAC